MKIMMWNVGSAMSRCARYIRQSASPSRVVDFTAQTTEAEKVLAYGLWDCYNINLPDTPRRMAMVINQILEKKGYYIGKL